MFVQILESKMEEIKQKIHSYKCFDRAAFAISVEIKAPIPMELAMRGLEILGERMPDLVVSDFNEEAKILSLKNGDDKTENQIMFKILDFNNFMFAWGLNAKTNNSIFIKQLSKLLIEDFKISMVNLRNLDIRLMIFPEYNKNQYQLIADTFYNNSINNLLEENKILQNDVYVIGIIDKETRAAIRVESDQLADEVFENKYSDNESFYTACAVGRLSGFPISANLESIFENHAKISCDYIKNQYIPNILEPLSKKLQTR